MHIKEKVEEEARKNAEEFNTFGEKCTMEFKECEEEMKKKHQREINNLVKCFTKKRGSTKKLSDLLKKHEQEINSLENEEEKKNIHQKHENEISDLIQKLLKEVNNPPKCSIS